MGLEIKMENGVMMAKRTSNGNCHLIGVYTFTISGFTIHCQHWIDMKNNEIYFVLSGISMLLMNSNATAENRLKWNGPVRTDDECYNQRIFYNKPVVLLIMKAFNTPIGFLVNPEGQVLGGSNIYAGDHKLCFGDTIFPLTPDPLHILFNHKANRDLSWIGSALRGTKQDNAAGESIFHVQVWPTINNSELPLPPEVKCACEDWSHS